MSSLLIMFECFGLVPMFGPLEMEGWSSGLLVGAAVDSWSCRSSLEMFSGEMT